MEWNVDRPGKNFTHFVLAQADPQLCLKECADRPNCVAWTYVKPNTTQGLKPLCWLKNAVPDPVPDNCCVSGVIK
jgi:hypothetical protein